MPMVKGKEGPLPSKTLQFGDFKKGLMRTGARDGIPPDGLWQSLNAQVIGPGHIITLTDPAPSIATITPGVVSLWGVIIQIDRVARLEVERLIAILTDGSALAIDPETGESDTITPAGGVDPAARVTMWQDSHVLFAGKTTGLSSWDGATFITYPSTFEASTTTDSPALVWVDGPIPAQGIHAGMAVSGVGIPAGNVIDGVGGEDLVPPATFAADTVNLWPTLLWAAGPTGPADIDVGSVVTGAGIPPNVTVLSVVGRDLGAAAPFTANTFSASSRLLYTGGLTPATDLETGLRVVGPGIPAGTTIVGVTGHHLDAGATFTAKTTSAKATLTYLGGATPITQIVAGLLVIGPGIPANTMVSKVVGTEITLSKAATATAASVTLTTGPTLTLSKNATATAAGVALTTGPTIELSAKATATGTAVVLTMQPTFIMRFNATATGTITVTVGAGVPEGTLADSESAGPRDVAVFEGRVWLVLGPRGLVFSGPGSFTAFGPVYAGQATTMPDSVFPGPITTIRAAIQLLWIFGPGGINTISNVQIVAGITTFQNENLVAGAGTPSADSVAALFRTMVFLSPPGVYAILGATPQKLSDQLDGLMPDVLPVGTGPAAVFNLNSLLVYAVLVDLAGQRRLLIYSRPTWLIGEQGTDLQWITTMVRIDGRIQCWGTNGTTIRQLFAGAEGDYDIRLKHFDFEMFTRRDTLRRIAVQAEIIPPTPEFRPDLQVEVENESASAAVVGGILTGKLTWLNDAGQETPWINTHGAPVTWIAIGTLVFLAETKFSGNLLSAHIFGRRSVPLIIGSVAMEVGLGGEWTFAP